MLRTVVPVVALSMSPLLAITGQVSRTLLPGEHIRVAISGPDRRLQGILLTLGPDSLSMIVTGGAGLVSIPRHGIRAVEIRQWSHSQAGMGADAGSLVGAIAGAALGAKVRQDECPSSSWFCISLPG